MKTKQIAERLNKHENTIRNYAQQYAEFFSSMPAKGEHRTFTDDDLRVMGFIARLSDSGLRQDDIKVALRRRLDEGTPFPPVLPSGSPSDVKGLVTVAELEYQLAVKDTELREMQARIEELRKQIEQYQQERDNYVQQIAHSGVAYMEHIARLSEEIGRLKAELSAKRS